jgi:nucleoside-specific outer membrane channel protein Tsx
MKLKVLASAFLISVAWALPAAADTSLELLHGWNYNKDFNGDSERTILTIKTFQPWDYGTFFAYYDITGPFTPPDSKVLPNEKGGFFGGMSATVSLKKIAEKIAGVEQPWNWGPLADLSLRYELEHVSKFGSLNYYGLQYDFAVPWFDFVSTSTVIRDDWSLAGADLQLNAAWQMTVPLGHITDLVFAGFLSWGLFGEGKGEFSVEPNLTDDNPNNDVYTAVPVQGRRFFITQPQLMLDMGKLARLTDGHLYAGIEYQFAFNRYLQNNVNEHVPQLLFKWKI